MDSQVKITTLTKRIIVLIFALLFLLCALYISTVYFYPFLLAFLFSLLFVPVINILENNLNWNRSIATLSVICSFLVLLLTFITFLIAELIHGLSYLTKVLPDYINDIIFKFYEWGENTWMPLFSQLNITQSDTLTHEEIPVSVSLEKLLNEAGEQLGNLVHVSLSHIREFLMAFPHAVTMILFALLASFFISKDWPHIVAWAEHYSPRRFFAFTVSFLAEWKASLAHYIKAQLILLAITAAIVFTGLLVLHVEYAFTTALLISVVDVLPYAGTGLVFIPWIIYSMINADWYMTAGLSVLYGIVVLQRQLTEPKIVSHQMGIPALLLLFTMFACYQFFGFAGVLLAPFIVILIQSLLKAGIADEIIYYLKK